MVLRWEMVVPMMGQIVHDMRWEMVLTEYSSDSSVGLGANEAHAIHILPHPLLFPVSPIVPTRSRAA